MFVGLPNLTAQAGAPTGVCNSNQFYVNTSNGNIYACSGSSWVVSGTGTVTFPATVAGTVNSGGIPYFNSTTQESSSATLTSNVLIKGGGAGGAPTSSLATDNATTLTYTGTGGISAPSFTGTGSGAGFWALTQGTTNEGNESANQVGFQAPTSVATKFLYTLPGAPAAGLFHATNATPSVLSVSAVVEADITLTNNTTNDVTTAAHGFAPKAPNDATKFLDGTGAYSVPASGGLTTASENCTVSSRCTTEGPSSVPTLSTTNGDQNTASVNSTNTTYHAALSIPSSTIKANTVIRHCADFVFSIPGTALNWGWEYRLGASGATGTVVAKIDGTQTVPNANGKEVTACLNIHGTAAAGASVSVNVGVEASLGGNVKSFNQTAQPVAGIATNGVLLGGFDTVWSGNTASYISQLVSQYYYVIVP